MASVKHDLTGEFVCHNCEVETILNKLCRGSSAKHRRRVAVELKRNLHAAQALERDHLRPGSKTTYLSHLSMLRKWGDSLGVNPLPKSGMPVPLLLAYMSHRVVGVIPGTVKTSLNAISKWHKERSKVNSTPLTDPTKDPRVKAALKGIYENYRVPVKRKLPVTLQQLKLFCELLPDDRWGQHQRVIAIFLFFGLLRASAAQQLWWEVDDDGIQSSASDVQFRKDSQGRPYVSIRVLRDKNLKAGDIHYRRIPNMPGFPAHDIVWNYVQQWELTTGYFLRAPMGGKTNQRRWHSAPFSKRAWASFAARFEQMVGAEKGDHGTHGFRRGFCMALFQAGVPVPALKELGNWKSIAIELYYACSPHQLIDLMCSVTEAGGRRGTESWHQGPDTPSRERPSRTAKRD